MCIDEILLQRSDNKSGQEIMNKHFSATIENIEHGRIYTLFTNYINSSSFWPTAASCKLF